MRFASSVRKRQWISIAIAIVVAGSVLSMLAVAAGRKPASPDAPASDGSVVLTADQYDGLTMETAQSREFRDQVTADGRISVDGDRTVQVYSPYTGLIEKVLVEPGQHVSRGQPLFLIRANEATQGAADLVAAEAALTTARAQEVVAEGVLRRAQAGYEDAGGAKKDVEVAQRDLVAAQGATATAQGALRAQQERLSIMDAGEPRAGKDGLGVVRSPSDGVVALRNIAPGQRLVDLSQVAFEVTDTTSVWLNAQVSEDDSNRVVVGQRIDVQTDAYPDRIFHAQVLSVAPMLDSDTHRLPVRARIENRDQALKPDMFATVSLFNATSVEGLAVPSRAVVREGQDARVWVVGTDRRAAVRHVTLGLSGNGYTQIQSGLRPGERVVVDGALFVDKAGLG